MQQYFTSLCSYIMEISSSSCTPIQYNPTPVWLSRMTAWTVQTLMQGQAGQRWQVCGTWCTTELMQQVRSGQSRASNMSLDLVLCLALTCQTTSNEPTAETVFGSLYMAVQGLP